jgi:hypothetical protein
VARCFFLAISCIDLAPLLPHHERALLHCMSAKRAKKRKHVWGFDDEQREVLLEATTNRPRLREVIERAEPHAHDPDFLVLEATMDELDEMYDLVSALVEATTDEERLELLDNLLEGLSTAIDHD